MIFNCYVTYVLISDDNGLNPTWDVDNSFDFDIYCPECAFLRFTVYDQDMFGEPNFLAQSSVPVVCVKPGEWRTTNKW